VAASFPTAVLQCGKLGTCRLQFGSWKLAARSRPARDDSWPGLLFAWASVLLLAWPLTGECWRGRRGYIVRDLHLLVGVVPCPCDVLVLVDVLIVVLAGVLVVLDIVWWACGWWRRMTRTFWPAQLLSGPTRSRRDASPCRAGPSSSALVCFLGLPLSSNCSAG